MKIIQKTGQIQNSSTLLLVNSKAKTKIYCQINFMKKRYVHCLQEKECIRTNRSIRHSNYPNLSLLSDTNKSSMWVASSRS